MKNYGRSSVSEFLADRIVYRNLNPYDPGLPPLGQIRQEIGLSAGSTPRKNEPEYARVIVYLLQQCLRQDMPGGKIERLVFVGDTRLLDGTAYANLCQAGGWPGLAFIGSEDNQPAAFQLSQAEGGQPLYLSNRWTALRDFDQFCAAQSLPVGIGTAVVIDLDKTAIGARGRNGQVIDQARLEAVKALPAAFLRQVFPQPGQPLLDGWRWVKLGEVVASASGGAVGRVPLVVSRVIEPEQPPGPWWARGAATVINAFGEALRGITGG
jgi:hypothetical protein